MNFKRVQYSVTIAHSIYELMKRRDEVVHEKMIEEMKAGENLNIPLGCLLSGKCLKSRKSYGICFIVTCRIYSRIILYSHANNYNYFCTVREQIPLP
jgi:hypothetical protein